MSLHALAQRESTRSVQRVMHNGMWFTIGVVMLITAAGLYNLSQADIGFLRVSRILMMKLSGRTDLARVDVIPRLLHYASKDDLVHSDYVQTMNSCITQNPGWTVHLWTNRDVKLLLERRWPRLMHLYTSLSSQGERESLAKYPILFLLGGVFLDSDVSCVRPLDSATGVISSALSAGGAFLAKERAENHMILENSMFKLTPAAIGSAPGHEWFGFVVDILTGRVPPAEDVNLDEGFLTECYRLWQELRVKQPLASPSPPALLPSVYFSPNLRDPETMLRLCDQLRESPQLAAVYTVRQSACTSAELWPSRLGVNVTTTTTTSIGDTETIGMRDYRLSAIARRLARSRVESSSRFNATKLWRLERYTH